MSCCLPSWLGGTTAHTATRTDARGQGHAPDTNTSLLYASTAVQYIMTHERASTFSALRSPIICCPVLALFPSPPPSPRVCVGRRAPTSGGRSRRSERLEMASALIWAARPLASFPPSHVNREAGVMSLCTCHQLESSAPVILLACRCFFSIAYSQMKASFRAQWKSFHWPAPLCGGDHTTRQYSLPRPRPPPPLGSVSSPRWFVRQLE